MFCGLDFGTSNSAIGTILCDHPVLLPLENQSPILPSAIFFNFETGHTEFGHMAVQHYIDGIEGRLMRALKSILGSTLLYNDTVLTPGKLITFDSVIALFLEYIKKTAETRAQKEFEQVIVGRPVHFVDGDPEADRNAQNSLEKICSAVGFKSIAFQFEPVAAIKSVTSHIKHEEVILVVDIGGGTSDFSVLRTSSKTQTSREKQQEVLANAGLHLGGTDFDKLLSLHYIMPLLGYGTNLYSKNLPFPQHFFMDLSTWHQINFLQQNRKAINTLQQLLYQAKEPDKINRLLKVLQHHLGYELIFAIEKAKIELSEKTTSHILLSFIEEGLTLCLNQSQLKAAIENTVENLNTAITTCLKQALISREQVTKVFFTGGSTLIPSIRSSILKDLPNAKTLPGDQLGAVAHGLSIEAFERYR
jgi:hypothetical chaperone protein